MRLKSSRKKFQTEEFSDQDVQAQKQAAFDAKGQRSLREARFRIYSCVFCEFVRDNLSDTDLGEEVGYSEGKLYADASNETPDVFETKYLYHLASVHGLRR